jgi:putative ABC transport system permease protein
VIGIVIATPASIGLSRLRGMPFSFDTRINTIEFLFSAGIGVLFGYLPARRAAQLDPMQALRHE